MRHSKRASKAGWLVSGAVLVLLLVGGRTTLAYETEPWQTELKTEQGTCQWEAVELAWTYEIQIRPKNWVQKARCRVRAKRLERRGPWSEWSK